MKKLVIILMFAPLVSFGQQAQGQVQATQVNVKNSTVNRVDYNIGNAARANAMSEATTEIKVPLTVDLYEYTHIALVDATFANNYGVQGADRETYETTAQNLANSPLTIIEPRAYGKKKFKKNMRYLRDIKNPKWIYFYFQKSIQGVDEIRSLVLRDYKNKIIYNVKVRNVPFSEVVSLLTEM